MTRKWDKQWMKDESWIKARIKEKTCNAIAQNYETPCSESATVLWILKRCKISESETKDFGNPSAAVRDLMLSCSGFLGFGFHQQVWVELKEAWGEVHCRKGVLAEGSWTIYVDSKHGCPLLQRNTLPVSAKAVCSTDVLKMRLLGRAWKGGVRWYLTSILWVRRKMSEVTKAIWKTASRLQQRC